MALRASAALRSGNWGGKYQQTYKLAAASTTPKFWQAVRQNMPKLALGEETMVPFVPQGKDGFRGQWDHIRMKDVWRYTPDPGAWRPEDKSPYHERMQTYFSNMNLQLEKARRHYPELKHFPDHPFRFMEEGVPLDYNNSYFETAGYEDQGFEGWSEPTAVGPPGDIRPENIEHWDNYAREGLVLQEWKWYYCSRHYFRNVVSTGFVDDGGILIFGGNFKGCGGWGMARTSNKETENRVPASKTKAIKNMVALNLTENGTIPYPITHRVGATRITMFPADYIRCPWKLFLPIYTLGIQGLVVKVHRPRRSILNMMKLFYECLAKAAHMGEIEYARGRMSHGWSPQYASYLASVKSSNPNMDMVSGQSKVRWVQD